MNKGTDGIPPVAKKESQISNTLIFIERSLPERGGFSGKAAVDGLCVKDDNRQDTVALNRQKSGCWVAGLFSFLSWIEKVLDWQTVVSTRQHFLFSEHAPSSSCGQQDAGLPMVTLDFPLCRHSIRLMVNPFPVNNRMMERSPD